jgi:hypothetical protein
LIQLLLHCDRHKSESVRTSPGWLVLTSDPIEAMSFPAAPRTRAARTSVREKVMKGEGGSDCLRGGCQGKVENPDPENKKSAQI